MKILSFQEKVQDLFVQIHELEQNESKKAERKLPSDCYFLSNDTVLCYRRGDGDARYPYSFGGMTLWAYSSGNVKMEEGLYNVILPAYEGKEPNLGFFAGIEMDEGFFPVSLLGTARQAFEKGVKRYTVFSPQAAYYLTESPVFWAAVRLFVDEEKLLRISLYLENKTNQPIRTYLSSFADFLMTQWSFEQDDAKFFKKGKTTDYGYFFHTTEGALDHYGAVARSRGLSVPHKAYSTTSRQVYAGSSHNQLSCAQSLLDGKFTREKGYTERDELTVETLSGIKRIWIDGESVTVDMGKVEVSDEILLDIGLKCNPVNVGNPHAVVFTDDVELVLLRDIGPKIECNEAFKGRVNAEFVSILAENKLRMRVWERGSGETQACGTGACASAAAAVAKGFCRADEPITVCLDGGELEITIKSDYTAIMRGGAEFVSEGEIHE